MRRGSSAVTSVAPTSTTGCLRTIVIADGTAHVQSGAGVVADSVPAREFDETLEKAGAMFAAVEQAEQLP